MAASCNLARCAMAAGRSNSVVLPAACASSRQSERAMVVLRIRSACFARREWRCMTCRVRGSEEIGGKTTLQLQQQRGREVIVKVASGEGISGAEEGGGEAALDFDISRLEAYTEIIFSEVLCVNALVEDEEDQVIVFKGFSSSLTRATPDDLSEPVLPPDATVLSIDRMRGPYNPSKPRYIQQGMSWQDFQPLLRERGL